MREDRSLVRASDLGLWANCHRAWWLAKIKDAPHRNPSLLRAGVSAHDVHGAQVQRAATLRRWAQVLVAIALLLAGLLLLIRVLP
jgi:hypothetical protein